MERSYWLSRKRASAANAASATSAEARLIHFELAGRYSVKAAAEDMRTPAPEPAQIGLAAPAGDGEYYQRLEIGARWLADGTSGPERDEHLAMANRYARLGHTPSGRGR